MVVLHDKDYNPKIDYLICKQLIRALPNGYDEDKIRACYNGNAEASEQHLTDIVAIKKFFEHNDIMQADNRFVEDLYEVCTHESVVVKKDISKAIRSDLQELAYFVNALKCDRNMMFRILFLVRYIAVHGEPIIPYSNLCDKLFYAVVANEPIEVDALYGRLECRVRNYMVKYSVADGNKCVQLLHEYKNSFLAETGALKLGYYGSYARGSATDYSDFDILAVFDDGQPLTLCKGRATEFWRSKLTIPFDVAVASQDRFDYLPKGIRRSAKFI